MAVINSGISSVGPDGNVTLVKPSGGSGSSSSTGSSSTSLPVYRLSPTVMLYDKNDGKLVALWDKSVNSAYVAHTEEYEYQWEDTSGTKKPDGTYVWEGGRSTTTQQQSFFTPSSGAIKVRFLVRPVQKEGSKVYTSEWSKEVIYNIPSENPFAVPCPTPSVSIDGLQLTAELNIDFEATIVNFQVQRNNTGTFHDTNINGNYITITSGTGTLVLPIWGSSEYRVRCRVGKNIDAYGNGEWTEWSEWTDNIPTIPKTPSGITKCEARTITSVYLEWDSVEMVDNYKLEYTTKKSYFDGSNEISSVTTDTTSYELTGLEKGKEYFFRVKAVNSQGESGWTEIKSVVIGKGPVAPTTWSSTTTAKLGETITLYWVHNTEDGSAQTYANLELDINGVVTTEVITGEVSKWVINTSDYTEGAKIKWRVQTAGITNSVGDWSIQRTVDIYAPPVLSMSVTDASGSSLSTLTSLPINISMNAAPSSQTPITYTVSIVANSSYETKDDLGMPMTVNSGQTIYSEHIEPSADNAHTLKMSLSAAELTLESGVEYSIICSVTMDSGLTAEARRNFTVHWDSLGYWPNANVNIDPLEFTAAIHPFCEKYVHRYYQVTRSGSTYVKTSTELIAPEGTVVANVSTTTGENVYQTVINGSSTYYCIVTNVEKVDDVLLSVYRRDIDGTFVEIASEIDASKNVGVSDPHPALDYARYRIVAKTKGTSEVFYYDIPAIYIGGTSIIIQWNERRSQVDLSESENLNVEPSWTGLGLLLPYNVSVSDKYSQDVEFAGYIGRENPVSYYGTQIGHTSTWNTEIPKSDTATIYGLRMLARWLGDAYVREPSGTGYWANVKVSFSKKYNEVTIPVTLEITRVEGGA